MKKTNQPKALALLSFLFIFQYSCTKIWKNKNQKETKIENVSNPNNYKTVNNKYEQLFTEIDSLIDLYQTIEVNKKIEKVLTLAQQENEHGYYYKGILYQFGNKDWGEEDEINLFKWQYLDSVTKFSKMPIQPFFTLFKAQFLAEIFDNKKYDYGTELITNDQSPNPNNWSKEFLSKEIHQYINQALLDGKDIQMENSLIPVFENAIINDIETTIEQTLVLKCIEILNIIPLTSTLKYQSPDLKAMFLPVSDFINHDFDSNDDPKNDYRILQLYQNLLKNYHIFWDLKRLEFLKTRFNKNVEYYDALKQLYQMEIEKPESNLIAKAMADILILKNKKQAHDLLTSAIEKHPNFSHNINLQLLINQIENMEVNAHFEKINQPNQKFLGKIEYKNLKTAYVSVLKMDYLKYYKNFGHNRYYYNRKTDTMFRNFIKDMPIMQSKKITLHDYQDFESHSAEFSIDGLNSGAYLLIFSNTENYIDSPILGFSKVFSNHFTNMSKNGNNYLVDAGNGNFLADIKYKLYEIEGYSADKKITKIKEGITTKDGYYEIPKNKYKNYLIEFNDGSYFTEQYSPYSNQDYKEKESTQFQLLTDRNLYRPGQTVYFKAIAYKNLAKKVIPNETYTIVLKDNNHQEKGRLQLKTNIFGSFSGKFELPKSGSGLGSFHIEILNHSSVWFKVEEYKLPKYKAEITHPQQAYKINDPIELTGKAEAFAGYPIQNANVTYTVTRKEKIFYWNYWSRYMPSQPSDALVLANENTTTDEKGTFKIKFKALPDDTKDNKTYYDFEVNATITDQNGEVKTCQYTLTLSEIDRTISINANPNYILNETVEIDYHIKNLQDKPLPFTGKIECFKIQSNNKLQRKRLWKQTDTTLISESEFQKDFSHYESFKNSPKLQLIHTQNFENNQQNKFAVPKQLLNSSGEYVFRISSKDGNGNPIVNETKLNVLPDKAGPIQLNQALIIYSVNGMSFEPNQTAKILIGGAVNSMVQIQINSNRGTILEKTILIKNTLESIEIPIKNEDRGGIYISAVTINDYRDYRNQLFINVPFSNKKIDVQLSSFRSDIEPGSKEKWKLKIKGPANEISKIESAAVMYNQALEQLKGQNQWNLTLYNNFSYNNISTIGFTIEGFNKRYFSNSPPLEFRSLNFKRIMSPKTQSPFLGFSGRGSRSDGGLLESISYNQAPTKSSKDKMENLFLDKLEDSDEIVTQPSLNSDSLSTPPPIRKNFNETAFFYPHLYTDAQGNLEMEFTAPEALTQWRMMLLAHSTSMQIGYLEQSITTSKKVMVQPNMPRFLRQNDQIELSSKIVNTTNTALTIDAQIVIKDLETGKNLEWLTNSSKQTITVSANGVSTVNFKLKIPDYIGMVSIAISAENKQISDGEEHTLLVISNRQLVTESLPITVRKAGIQNLEFSHLKNNSSSSLKHEKLSIEMSENPAWYAIQALPYMMEYPYECAEQTFTRLYANSIATHLAQSSPEIKKVYQTWVEQAKNGKGLQSKLSQNQELKSVLIEETPWLREANSETKRMQQLGELFDAKTMNQELEKSFNKLKDMQMDNGAWGWFKGMYPNEYITQTIVIGFGKMKKMGINIQPYADMINRAISYLDQSAQRDYQNYKKQSNPQYLPSNLQYLYCKSYFPELGFNKEHEVVKFYLDNAEKTWQNAGIMNMAQLLVAIKTLKPSSDVPPLILKAFEQNAKNTPEMGMYWSKNISGWYWYQAPIETQAAIIEAYKSMGKTKEIVDMQVWLMRQKQTQNWSTTRSTADACYAILSNNNFIKNQQSVVVSLNNTEIKPEQKEAGTGYYKHFIEANKISSSLGNVTVNAKTNDFAYGAIYWQYFEDLDKIQSAARGLSINKKIFKLVNTDKGQTRLEVNEQNTLKVGDLIEIVLLVSSDRNLEFVHIKDGRASGTEPQDVMSVYKWQNGLGYYQSTRDASSNFFIDNMNKGTYQLSYILKVEQAGTFNSGIATVQCMYAPEFVANSKALLLKVE
ncbi:MAG: alpha-2-macroglobulin family protein [Bacteroidota bacterium]|nr:alpha-2-macroglobulin family protein [Bacteroidota bacterium]